ncbi:MAG: twin-arginine translocation signal domain-containing protein [Rubrivivax sp.]
MRAIPISTPAAASGCDEESGRIPKLDLPLVRREFLKGSGVLMGTLAAGSVLAALAPSTAWAVELKVLSKAEGETLMKMGRTLYPHDKLPDAVYALLAKDLDAAAAGDAATATLLKEGIAGLDKATGGFARASAAKRLAAVKAIEGTPFFGAVRGKCITSLYDNDMAYKVFGYEGASFDKGGYITRGFQDLTWLPAPDEAASPKPLLR